MTSKNSFLVNCIENNKRRIWVWVAVLLSQLALYPGMMTVYLSRIKHWNGENRYASAALYQKALNAAAADAVGFKTICLFPITILAALTAIQGFSYLHDRKKVDFYYSVPVSTKRRFFVIYGNGIAIYLFSYLTSVILALLFALTQGALTGAALIECGLAFLMNILYFLAVYHTAILAVMITGNLVVSTAATAGLLLAEYTMVQLFNQMKALFFKTYSYGLFRQTEAKFSVLIDYDRQIYPLKLQEDMGKNLQVLLPMFGRWLVVIIVTFLLAYLGYRKRPVEAAGKPVVFDRLKPLIKIFAALAVGFEVCSILYETSYQNALLAAAAMLGATVLCCMVIEVIYEYDVRAVIKHLFSTGLCAAVVLIIFGSFYFDLFGYDEYIPEKDQIESAAFYLYSGYQSYFEDEWADGEVVRRIISPTNYIMEHMFLTDTEAIRELAELNQNADWEAMKDARPVDVLYRLRSGRLVCRYYMVDFADAENAELLDRIVGTKEYRDGFYQTDSSLLQSKDLEITYGSNALATQLPSGDGQRLLELWQRDMEKYDFTLARNSIPCGNLLFSDQKYYGAWEFPVYECFTETIAYLKEKNAYYPAALRAKDVACIEISAYHYMFTEYSDVAERAEEIRRVEKSFEDPAQIEQIIPNLYPSDLQSSFISRGDVEAAQYEITIAFRADSDYPYGKGYYSYFFLDGQVPDFVARQMAYVPE